MPFIKLGSDSGYYPQVAAALEAELGITERGVRPQRDQWLRTLVTELARVQGLNFRYVGESYGFRLEYGDEYDGAFLQVMAARQKLDWKLV